MGEAIDFLLLNFVYIMIIDMMMRMHSSKYSFEYYIGNCIVHASLAGPFPFQVDARPN